MMRNKICILIILLMLFSYAKGSNINISAKGDSVPRRFLFGGGFNLGIFHPAGFYDYVQSYANRYNLDVGNSFDDVNFGLQAFIGFKITSTFDLDLAAGLVTSTKNAYNNRLQGRSFSLDKTSLGLIGNKAFPINRRIDLIASGGLLYNKIEVSTMQESLYSGNCAGFRIQGGVTLHSSRFFMLRGLIGGEYASVVDRSLEMNYSGLLVTINAVFLK